MHSYETAIVSKLEYYYLNMIIQFIYLLCLHKINLYSIQCAGF